MTKTKICGITNTKDALLAAKLGAWAVGFIFYKKSPRSIGGFKAQKIVKQLPPFVTPVGVFVNQKEGAVKDILDFCGITTAQFHGDESASYCKRFGKKYKVIKALRVSEKFDPKSVKDFPAAAFLLDTLSDEGYGGTGKTFDWQAAKAVKNFGKPVILSGGLNPENVLWRWRMSGLTRSMSPRVWKKRRGSRIPTSSSNSWKRPGFKTCRTAGGAETF